MKIRDLILRLAPADTRAEMEAQSRRWLATCPKCGVATSIWAHGGLRYKAAGEPSKRLRCPACGEQSSQPVRWA